VTIMPYTKEEVTHVALELIHPMLMETLIENADFRDEYGLICDAVISFNECDISFQRSDIYNAVRKCLSGAPTIELLDKRGQKWEVKIVGEEKGIPLLGLFHCKQRLILPNIAGLSPNRTVRIRYLDEVASKVNLPNCVQEKWRNILSANSFNDDEVDDFYREYYETPVEQSKDISSELKEGHISLSSLVLNSRKYFERLIGAHDGSASVADYARGNGRNFIERLSKWRPYDGFLFSLLLASHSALTEEINVDLLSSEELMRALEFLEKYGDRISQLGAIEVGLRIFPSRPEIESNLIRLIEQVRDDDVERGESSFKLTSALFFLVYGELSRIRLFISEPPFYRRLAALAQAALIHRQLLDSGADLSSFCDWALSNCVQQFYIQSLADMRIEPRWKPWYAEASQMKAEFFGRIMNAAVKYEKNIEGSRLYDVIRGTGSESLSSLSKFPYPFFPGPLEGAEDIASAMPKEISKAIEEQLNTEEITPSSFLALVNSAMLFHIDADKAAVAAKTLKIGSYRLANIQNRSQLLNVLDGLAMVAGITRSNDLANELRILVRIYRRDSQYALSIEEVLRLCLVSASSRKGLIEWRDFLGEWLTELAFSDLEGNESEVLHFYLQYLCHIVPELWVTCGRADAALTAYNAQKHRPTYLI